MQVRRRFSRDQDRQCSYWLLAPRIYLLALAALAVGQRKLLYFPYARDVAPASVGLPKAETLHLQTDDGERLLAWYIAPAPGRPLILYFHGNANGLADRGRAFPGLDGVRRRIAGRGISRLSRIDGIAVGRRAARATARRPSSRRSPLGVPAARIVADGRIAGNGRRRRPGRAPSGRRAGARLALFLDASMSRRRVTGCFRCAC